MDTRSVQLKNTSNSATENLLHFNSILLLPGYLTIHMTSLRTESLIAKINRVFRKESDLQKI